VYLRGSRQRVLDPKAVLARGALADAQGIVVADCTEERSEDAESGVEPGVATAIASDSAHCQQLQSDKWVRSSPLRPPPPAHPRAPLRKGAGRCFPPVPSPLGGRMYWAWLPGPLLLVTTGNGTESWTLRSCKRSFLAVSVMICSWSRWFSFCSECRALSISTTAGNRKGKGDRVRGEMADGRKRRRGSTGDTAIRPHRGRRPLPAHSPAARYSPMAQTGLCPPPGSFACAQTPSGLPRKHAEGPLLPQPMPRVTHCSRRLPRCPASPGAARCSGWPGEHSPAARCCCRTRSGRRGWAGC